MAAGVNDFKEKKKVLQLQIKSGCVPDSFPHFWIKLFWVERTKKASDTLPFPR